MSKIRDITTDESTRAVLSQTFSLRVHTQFFLFLCQLDPFSSFPQALL